MSPDTLSTTAGAGIGLHLLSTVQWNLIPCGETVKLGVALVIILGGYLMYRKEAK